MRPHDFDENGLCRACKRVNKEVGYSTHCRGNSNAVDAAERLREVLLPINEEDRETAWYLAGFCDGCGSDTRTDGPCHCRRDD